MPKSCLYPHCSSSPVTRGLCRLHYQQAYRLVQSGKTTWAQLKKEGKVTSTGTTSEEAADWFLNSKKPTRIQRIRESSSK